MIAITIYILLTVLFFYGLSLVFEKAGTNKWLAFVPVYNLFVWMKVIKKPWWWVLILVFPGVNFLMFMVMCAQTVYCLNRRSVSDTLLAAFVPFFYITYLGNDKNLAFVGPPPVVKKKSVAKEWVDALIFAVIAASIIRGYFLEAFTIPTSSLEKTLLKGDYLFVSKINYGPKLPNTPLSFPFAHHTIPGTRNVKSYLKWIKLPYYRLPGFQDVKRNDLVVFNFPEGDTVIVDIQDRSYYQVMREFQQQYGSEIGRQLLLNGAENIRTEIAQHYRTQYLPYLLQGKINYRTKEGMSHFEDIYKYGFDITVRPVDKQENYIKRCVGIPGDKLEFKKGELFIDDKPAMVPEHIQFRYIVKTSQPLTLKNVKKDLKINYDINPEDIIDNGMPPNQYLIVANPKVMNAVAKAYNIEAVIPTINLDEGQEYKSASVFPNDTNYRWTQDNFGPVTLPKRGMKMDLNLSNIAIYKRAITVYEGNTLEIKDGQIIINNQPVTSYTFKMNYYMLVGDNRHNSLDSRYWGFVPEDHVVGKAVFIWMSIDPDLDWSEGAIRWKRFFTLAHQD